MFAALTAMLKIFDQEWAEDSFSYTAIGVGVLAIIFLIAMPTRKSGRDAKKCFIGFAVCMLAALGFYLFGQHTYLFFD